MYSGEGGVRGGKAIAGIGWQRLAVLCLYSVDMSTQMQLLSQCPLSLLGVAL